MIEEEYTTNTSDANLLLDSNNQHSPLWTHRKSWDASILLSHSAIYKPYRLLMSGCPWAGVVAECWHFCGIKTNRRATSSWEQQPKLTGHKLARNDSAIQPNVRRHSTWINMKPQKKKEGEKGRGKHSRRGKRIKPYEKPAEEGLLFQTCGSSTSNHINQVHWI